MYPQYWVSSIGDTYHFTEPGFLQITALFQFLCQIPKRYNHIPRKFGKAMDAEHRKKEKERIAMKNNNQINIPQAREAMDKFKMQAASEVGVNLTNGYNGHLTSREAGSVGGQMVKKMIEAYEQNMQ